MIKGKKTFKRRPNLGLSHATDWQQEAEFVPTNASPRKYFGVFLCIAGQRQIETELLVPAFGHTHWKTWELVP